MLKAAGTLYRVCEVGKTADVQNVDATADVCSRGLHDSTTRITRRLIDFVAARGARNGAYGRSFYVTALAVVILGAELDEKVRVCMILAIAIVAIAEASLIIKHEGITALGVAEMLGEFTKRERIVFL